VFYCWFRPAHRHSFTRFGSILEQNVHKFHHCVGPFRLTLRTFPIHPKGQYCRRQVSDHCWQRATRQYHEDAPPLVDLVRFPPKRQGIANARIGSWRNQSLQVAPACQVDGSKRWLLVVPDPPKAAKRRQSWSWRRVTLTIASRILNGRTRSNTYPMSCQCKFLVKRREHGDLVRSVGSDGPNWMRRIEWDLVCDQRTPGRSSFRRKPLHHAGFAAHGAALQHGFGPCWTNTVCSRRCQW